MNLPFLKSPQGEDPIVMEAEFAASVSRLFQAWTTPDDIKQWFGAGDGGPETAVVELREGGRWEFVFPEKEGQTDSLSGEYLRIETDKHLEFTWVHTRTLADGKVEKSGESVVTVEFEKRSGGAYSKLVHKAVAAQSSRSNIGGGWSSSFSKIKALIE